MVVFGGTDHHKQLGAVQIGPAELPEGTAYGIDQPCGHIHRAETAVCSVVRRAELLGEHSGQRLHLVAAGKQRKLLGVFGAQLAQALLQDLEDLLPGDLLEVRIAAFAAAAASQRLGQPRRRILFHNPRRTLGADHAFVQRVVGIALDVPNLAVAQGDADPAAAGTHITGGVLDLLAACLGVIGKYGVQHGLGLGASALSLRIRGR